MAALVLVLMMPVYVGVLVGVSPGLMGVFMPVMAVGTTFVAMLVLMFVFVMATHNCLTPFFVTYRLILNISSLVVNGFAATAMGLDNLPRGEPAADGTPAVRRTCARCGRLGAPADRFCATCGQAFDDRGEASE